MNAHATYKLNQYFFIFVVKSKIQTPTSVRLARLENLLRGFCKVMSKVAHLRNYLALKRYSITLPDLRGGASNPKDGNLS